MQIAELYDSLQGEGLLAGTPSVFVRTSGCNLRCHWCDSPFTSWEPQGRPLSAAAVVAAVAARAPRHVVVTGGEPLLVPEVVEACRELRGLGRHVTIETAATVASEAPADLLSLSPKLANSTPPATTPGNWAARHDRLRRRDDAILALLRTAAQHGGEHQFKFVIDSPADLDETTAWLDDLEAAAPGVIDRGRVFLMPQGTTPDELARTTRWLEPLCRARGFRLGHRFHIEWFGHTRGT